MPSKIAKKVAKKVVAKHKNVRQPKGIHITVNVPGNTATSMQAAKHLSEILARGMSSGRIEAGERIRIPDPVDFQAAPEIPAKKQSVLNKAEEIIYGDRERTYGEPGFNLQSIADLWTVYLRRRNPEAHIEELTPPDVCQLMILLKTGRLIKSPDHIDSLVDQCGYAALQERVI